MSIVVMVSRPSNIKKVEEVGVDLLLDGCLAFRGPGCKVILKAKELFQ